MAQPQELEEATDAGRDWHENHTESLMAGVYRHASRLYDNDGLGKTHVMAFAEGFTQARQRRDAWLHEKQQEV